MADQLTIVMSAEEARLWLSITSTVSKMGQMERGFSKITEEARKSARANQELERAAKGMLQGLQSPLDRHSAKLAEINRVYEAGKISVGQYSRLVRQLTEEFSRSTDAGRRAAAAAQEFAARQNALRMRGPTMHDVPGVLFGRMATEHRMPLIDLQGDFQKVAAAQQRTFGAAAIAQLTGYVAGMLSIGAAVGILTSAYRTWRAEMSEIAKFGKQFLDDQIKLLAKLGDFAEAPRLRKTLNIPGVLPGESQQIFKAVGTAAPEATLERREALTRAVGAAIPAMGGEDIPELAAQVGQMESYAPGREAGQSVAFAVQARRMAGEHAANLTSDPFKMAVHTLTSIGMSPERATAMMITAMHLGQRRPDALLKMAEAMKGKWKPAPIRTQEDLTKYKFYQLDPEKRFQALLEDEEISQAMLGEKAALKIGQYRAGNIAEQEKKLGATGARGMAFLRAEEEKLEKIQEGALWLRTRAVLREKQYHQLWLKEQTQEQENLWEEEKTATEDWAWPRRYAHRWGYAIEEAIRGMPARGQFQDDPGLKSSVDANTRATDANTRGQRVGAAGDVNRHSEQAAQY